MRGLLGALGSGLVELVLPSLATVISGFVIALLRKKAKQAGLDLTAQQEERLKQLVRDGIRKAEEVSTRSVKLGEPALAPVDKQAVALDYVQNQLPDLDTNKVLEAIDVQLPRLRAINFGPNPGLPGGGRR